MPNRILRDWTDSEIIDSLDVHAERFFTRLIMKVDDFGRYSANKKLLKSTMFPLKTDIRETDIALWLTACEKCGLVALYSVAQKEYLQIENFKQTLRQKVEKYPSPLTCVADATQPLSTCSHETKGNETENERRVHAPDLSNSNLYRKPIIPEWQEVHRVFVQRGGNEEMAKKFFEGNNATGWYKGGSPIVNFATLVPGFISNWKSFTSKQPSDGILTKEEKFKKGIG